MKIAQPWDHTIHETCQKRETLVVVEVAELCACAGFGCFTGVANTPHFAAGHTHSQFCGEELLCRVRCSIRWRLQVFIVLR